MHPNTNDIVTHFETLYGKEAEGYIMVATGTGGKFRHTGFPFHDRRLAAQYMAEQTRTQPTYATFALHDQSAYETATRKNDTALVIPGVVLDIDLAVGVHAAKNLPTGADEAMALLDSSGVPSPTLVVNSGGGLYAYWLFEAPFTIRSGADRTRIANFLHGWHARVDRVFRAAGLKLDKVTDLARIFRVPGCLNGKTDPPKPVLRLDLGTNQRWAIEKLEKLVLPVETGGKPPDREAAGDFVRQLRRQRHAALSSDVKAAEGMLSMIAGCDFVSTAVEGRAQLDEPTWKSLADLLAHIPKGDEFFHLISQADARYDHRETEEKLKRAKAYGPKRCQTLAETHPGCATCPFGISGSITSPAALVSTPPELVELQRRYILDAKTGLYFEPAIGANKTKDDFNRSYARRMPKGNVTREFETSRTSVIVDDHDYLVGNGNLIVGNGNLGTLNTWRDGGVAAALGDASLWLDHISFLIPDENERKWLLQYLAHLIQRPGIKINSAVLIQSVPGVGKNLMADAMSRMMHTNDTRVVTGTILNSRWKADMGNTRLLVLDEMQLSELRDAENEMKPWVTEEKTDVERKGIDRYSVRTPRGILIFSNHDRPIAIQEGDRRVFVVKVAAEKRPPSYYTRLATEGMSDAVISAFKHHLLALDLSDFLPKAAPPVTEAKLEIIRHGRSSMEQYLEWMRNEGLTPFDGSLYSVDAVVQALKVRYGYSANPQSLAKTLSRMGDEKISHRVTIPVPMGFPAGARGRVAVWAWRDVESWKAASEAEIKVALQARGYMAPNAGIVGADHLTS